MRLALLLSLTGCFSADRVVVVATLHAKKDTAHLRQDLDNVWPGSVGCEGTVAECVAGVREALRPEEGFSRSWARVADGSLDMGFEGDFPVEKLKDVGITRIREVRGRRVRERFAMLVTPEPHEHVAVAGRHRRYELAEGDTEKHLWVLTGRRHTVTLEWLATEEGRPVTAPKWVTPQIEGALREAGLLEG
ncbi:MAG: hypothetical protein ACOZNI_00275 [Myxococcota bacterium]